MLYSTIQVSGLASGGHEHTYVASIRGADLVLTQRYLNVALKDMDTPGDDAKVRVQSLLFHRR